MEGQTASRFSLLLLGDGEVLLSDTACRYKFSPASSHFHESLLRATRSFITGRMKIATRSIFFDADDWRLPVLRFQLPFSTAIKLEKDPISHVSFNADTVVLQRTAGEDHPYEQVGAIGLHEFAPIYIACRSLREDLTAVCEIAQLPSRRIRETAVRDLVRSKEARIPFDITSLQHGVHETTNVDAPVSAIFALSRAPGRVRITTENLYFMPIYGDARAGVERIPVHRLLSIRRLRHGCTDAALEISYCPREGPHASPMTLMLSFQNKAAREAAFASLTSASSRKIAMFGREELQITMSKWRAGEISNYDYLMFLNLAAGRSFNDLSQYPVFPWVLANYSSEELDLEDPSMFRDLSKPIGALESNRLAILQERYNEMPEPRFHYGTHYSTPGYLINFLVRAAPGAMLRLQNGCFDKPDRIFHSIADTWRGVMSNQADVKELIPEFYALNYAEGGASGIVPSSATAGQFLENVLGLRLGTRQDGKRVDNVELPPWAKGSSEVFVVKMREALECRIVSENLHSWIDLVFGMKIKSPEAHNVFYTDVALPRSFDDEELRQLDSEEISRMETIYLEFGRTPEQLFKRPHPPRFGAIATPRAADVADYVSSLQSLSPSSRSGSFAPRNNSNLSSGESSAFFLRRMDIRSLDIPSPCAFDSAMLTGSEESGDEYGETRKSASPKSTSLPGIAPQMQHSLLKKSLPCESLPRGNGDVDDSNAEISTVGAVTSFQVCNPESDSHVVCALLADYTAQNGTVGMSSSQKPKYALCTLCDDGHLRVHLDSMLVRSRIIEECSSIAYISHGVIAYGTDTGQLGLYLIHSGRTEIVATRAHESRISCVNYSPELSLLVTASRDALVKIWRVTHRSQRPPLVELALELDAESHVLQLAITHGNDSLLQSKCDLEVCIHNVIVAVTTVEGRLVVWEPRSYTPGDAYLEPSWCTEVEDSSVSSTVGHGNKLAQKLCWLKHARGCTSASNDGARSSIALAYANDTSECVTIWQWTCGDGGNTQANAEIETVKACCVTACSQAGTIVTGTACGSVAEFDCTGLLVGRCETGAKKRIDSILMQQDSKALFAVAADGTVRHVPLPLK